MSTHSDYPNNTPTTQSSQDHLILTPHCLRRCRVCASRGTATETLNVKLGSGGNNIKNIWSQKYSREAHRKQEAVAQDESLWQIPQVSSLSFVFLCNSKCLSFSLFRKSSSSACSTGVITLDIPRDSFNCGRQIFRGVLLSIIDKQHNKNKNITFN